MNRHPVTTTKLLTALAATLGLGLLPGAARADWIGPITGTTHNYLLPANWAGGVIDNVITNGTGTPNYPGPTFFFTNNWATTGNLRFIIPNNEGDQTLRGQSGDRVLTLNGDFLYDRPSSGGVILGSTTAGQGLTIDLGGGTRTFQSLVGTDTLTINNDVTNGSLVWQSTNSADVARLVTSTSYTGSTRVRGHASARFNIEGPAATSALIAEAGTIALTNANGTALNADGYLEGGTLKLANNAVNNNNRLGDSRAVHFNGGGTLLFQGVNSGASTETVGARFNGFATVIVTNGTGVATAALTLNADRSERGLFTLQADQGNSKLLFTTAPALIGAGGSPGTTTMSIVPWALSGANSTLTFATYDNTAGFRPLSATEIVGMTVTVNSQKTNLHAAAATENVRVISTAGDGAGIDIGATSKTVNSLIYRANGNGNINGAGGVLTISSGGLGLVGGGNPLTVNVSQLNFGGNEGVITVNGVGQFVGPDVVNISSVITNTGSNGLTLRGFSNTDERGRIVLSGANKYTGDTTIAFGRVEISNGAAIPDSSAVRVNSFGTLRLAGNETIGGLFGSGLVTNDASARTLTVDNAGAYTFSGRLVSGLSLVKNGAGAQTLSGTNNTYTGTTVINAGALLVNGVHTGGGAYTVNSGGTIGGTGSLTAALTLGNGATLSPGTSPGTLTLGTLTLGALTVQNGADYLFEGGDLTAVTGTLDLDDNWTLSLLQNGRLGDGGSITLFTYGSLAASPELVPTFDLSQLGFTPSGGLSLTDTGSSIVLNGIQLVPEPSTLLLLGVGGFLVWRRARGKR